MSQRTKTNPNDKSTDAADRTRCHKCKGAGVISVSNGSQKEAVSCDQCDTGRLIWSRLLELLSDIDVPSPLQAQPKTTDSIIRDQAPRRYPPPRV